MTTAATTTGVARPYGLIAEYDTPEQLVTAATAARRVGFTRLDAYTPYPVEALEDALALKPTNLGFLVLLAGVAGAIGGFFMQWYAAHLGYPLNIGGRPLFDWPTYVVITFELTVLVAAFTAGLVMFARNGLPRLYHPVFNTPGFERATRDGFFLCIEAVDPRFDLGATRAFLESTAPVRVQEVEP